MRKAFQLVAGIGSMVATYHRVRNGRRPVKPDSQLGHAGNFLYLLTAKKPDDYSEWAYDKVCILYGDHEMNASTFALRVTCSTLADIGGAGNSAVAALVGPLHGGANPRAMEMLGKVGGVRRVVSFVDGEVAAGDRNVGFG